MKNLIKNRLPVILIGIPSVLLIVDLGGIIFSILLSIVSLVCLFEFYYLAKEKDITPDRVIGSLAVIIACYFYFILPKVSLFWILSFSFSLIILSIFFFIEFEVCLLLNLILNLALAKTGITLSAKLSIFFGGSSE